MPSAPAGVENKLISNVINLLTKRLEPDYTSLT